jgi:hypothetical protein
MEIWGGLYAALQHDEDAVVTWVTWFFSIFVQIFAFELIITLHHSTTFFPTLTCACQEMS